MSTRFLAKAKTSQQASSAVKTSLLKNSAAKQVQVEDNHQQLDKAKQSSFQHDFSQVSVQSSYVPLIQPKLIIGKPSDRYEQEADRVAEQIMQMPASGAVSSTHSSIQTQFPSIQPLRTAETPSLQRESEEQEEDDEEQVQAKSYPGKSPTTNSTVQAQLASSSSGGQLLPHATRAFMESRFGRDFSSVRVHSDDNAASMNRQLNAKAFTHRQHIYFGNGQYHPQTRTGQQLLAHELTHVVQQTGGRGIKPKLDLQGRALPPTSKNSTPALTTSPEVNHSHEHASGVAQAKSASHVAQNSFITFSSSSNLGLHPIISQTSNNLQKQEEEESLIDSALSFGGDVLESGIETVADVTGIDIRDYVDDIPGYSLFTVIIEYDPIRRRPVDRNAINLVKGLLELLGPIGGYIFDTLQEHQILEAAFNWVKEQLKNLDLSQERLQRTIDAFLSDLGIGDVLDVAEKIQHNFSPLVRDVESFARSLIDRLIEMIKEVAIGLAEDLLDENQAWDLIKKVLHYDPLRGEEVNAPTVEILEDFLRLIGKEQELEQMRERGTLQETADWLDTQLGTFSGLLLQFTNLFANAWSAIQPENLPNLGSNLQSLANQIFEFLRGVGEFALTIALKVLEIIKNALLGLLQEHANTIPGYHLLTVMVGKDVFTQQEVPLTPTNLIHGFMSLMPGGEEQFQQMQETGVIPKAAERIESAMTELGISWPFVRQLFLDIWDSFTIKDMASPIDTFIRVLNEFAEPLSRLFTFVIEVVKVLLELILVMMNFPTDLIGNIISNALQALDDIQRDPVGFLINLLETAKLGFQNFFDNILEHLTGGLVDWLLGEVREAGIEPPADLSSFESILGFVLDILGLSIEHMWELLAEQVGQETVDRIRGAIDRLTGAWNFIQDVQERGFVAIWEYIESQLTNLWDMVLGQVQEWVMERVINVGMRWLMSFLDASGITPVINSFIAVFNAIESAIEYLNEMLAVINDFVSTVASIARGDIQPGAERMEQGLSNSIPIVIGFLANQFGLDNLGEHIQEIIAGARLMVDEALRWLIAQALRLGGAVLRSLGFGGETATTETEATAPQTGDPQHDALVQAGLMAINEKENRFLQNGEITRENAEQVASEIRRDHPVFRSFTVVNGGTTWDYEYVASPGTKVTGEEKAENDSSSEANEPPQLAVGERVEFKLSGEWERGRFLRYTDTRTQRLVMASIRLRGTRTDRVLGKPEDRYPQEWRLLTAQVTGGISVPTVTFSSSRFPHIVQNIKDAFTQGKPSNLRRLTDRSLINQNRNQAIGNLASAGTGLSWDEYPFATTYEGGSGAVVMAVPQLEQSSQGGILSSFYQTNSIEDGDEFRVQV